MPSTKESGTDELRARRIAKSWYTEEYPGPNRLVLARAYLDLLAERDALREALEQLDKIAKESAGVIAAAWLRRYIADALERPE